MKIRGFLQELRRRNVLKIAVAYTATGAVLLEVLTHLFHNFEAPHWVLKVITSLLILGLPVACLLAWGFEVKEGRVRSVPREPEPAKPALPGPETAAPPPSIAVLPFEDMSPGQDQKYLGNGIAEELLNALAAIDELKVAARTSSFSLASRGASMKEIGDTLHVRHVLEGSLRRSGQRLRVTAQLIDVETGFHLFSQAYDREAKDVFDIQNEIAREIAGALLPKLGLDQGVPLVRQGTSNVEAYSLRLEARSWLTAPDPLTASRAIGKLRQALERDPHYADAWGDLAYIKGYTTSWTGDPVPLIVEAEGAATLALHYSPNNVIALLWRAFLCMLVNRDAAAAADYYERARQAGGDQSLWAFQRAYCYDATRGRFDEGIEILREAERRDPLASNVKGALIEMYLGAGRPAEALRVAEAALAQELTAFDSLTNAGRAFVANGDCRRGRELLDKSRALTGEHHLGGILLQFDIDSATGDRAGALRRTERLLQARAEDAAVSGYAIGEGFKAAGDYDRTIQWWTSAVERHETWSLTLMPARNRNHPVIGKDPRFLALLERMGLQQGAARIG